MKLVVLLFTRLARSSGPAAPHMPRSKPGFLNAQQPNLIPKALR